MARAAASSVGASGPLTSVTPSRAAMESTRLRREAGGASTATLETNPSASPSTNVMPLNITHSSTG